MPELLSTRDAAQRLGIQPATLYAWLAESDAGTLVVRGVSFTINYFQGGRRGQGRIQIAETEIERLLKAMRATPRRMRPQRPPQLPSPHFPGISVKIGLPSD